MLFLFVFIHVQNVVSQNKYYYSEILDIKFKISEHTEIKENELEGVKNELFIVSTPNKDLKYVLTITKK